MKFASFNQTPRIRLYFGAVLLSGFCIWFFIFGHSPDPPPTVIWQEPADAVHLQIPKKCIEIWSAWSQCSSTCGAGEQRRQSKMQSQSNSKCNEESKEEVKKCDDLPLCETQHQQSAETVQSDEMMLSPLVEHITGRWTPQLHSLQQTLVMQLAGSEIDQQLSAVRYRRSTAPQPHFNDEDIARRLRSRECCNEFLLKVTWTTEDMLRDLKHFLIDIYPNRPVSFNMFGMRVSHAFSCWFITKWLKPKYIIESGVHLGQSTWLLRQAAPTAHIISLDPRADMVHWDTVNSTYYTSDGVLPRSAPSGIDIHPFVDFSKIDWSFITDKSSTLILWDDHQNEYNRVLLAHSLGFKRMMFDDNWSPLQGDSYSVKQVCDETGGLAYRKADFPSKLILMCDSFHLQDRFITLEEHQQHHKKFREMLKVYYESPPILFVPAHMEYTAFGHKPKVDLSPVQYVLPRPSNRLLKSFAESTIPPPLVQSQEVFDSLNLKSLRHREFDFYMSFGYAELI